MKYENKVVLPNVVRNGSARFLFRTLALVLFLAWLSFTCPAWASSGETSGAHGLPPFSEFFHHLISYWINFLTYCALLYFLLRKPLGQMWANRRQVFVTNIKAAGEKLENSKRLLGDAEVKLAGVTDARRRLREEIEAEAREESKRIVTSAQSRAEMLLSSARQMAEAERVAAQRAIQNEIVDMALKLAREKLALEVTVASDRPARESAISVVSELAQ